MAHLNVQYLYDICFCTISQLNFCQIVGGCSGNLAAQTQLAFIKQCLYLRICVLCISARICPSVEAPGSLACDAPGWTNWPPAAPTRSPTMPKARKIQPAPIHENLDFHSVIMPDTSYINRFSPIDSTNLWNPNDAQTHKKDNCQKIHYITVWCVLSFGTNPYQTSCLWISLNTIIFISYISLLYLVLDQVN